MAKKRGLAKLVPLSMRPDQLAELDEAAKSVGVSRSTFVQLAVKRAARGKYALLVK